jgi:phosphatidylglycerophosphate synthase
MRSGPDPRLQTPPLSGEELRQLIRKPGRDAAWLVRPYRYGSERLSPVFIRLGASANQVTVLSLGFALVGSLLLVQLSILTLVAAIVSIHLFILLDQVDGEVARYEAQVGAARKGDLSGSYLDFLVHLLQTPSFFVCLGIGLTSVGGSVAWAVAGVVAGFASAAYPRLVAQRTVLLELAKDPSPRLLRFSGEHLVTHILKEGGKSTAPFLVPRNREQARILAKQLLGWPGNLLLFTALAIGELATGLDRGFPLLKGYLAAYAILRLIDATAAWVHYLRLLQDPAVSDPTPD